MTERRPLVRCLVLAFLALASLRHLAHAAASGLPGEDVVVIEEPDGQSPKFGEGEIRLGLNGIHADAVRAAEAFLDGRSLGEETAAPFRWLVDFGQQNLEHEARVKVELADGRTLDLVRRTPSFHVDDEVTVELRQLYVSVLDGDRRVLDLGRDQFKVLDDGREQELVTFSGGDVPFAAVLMLDSSASMKGPRMAAALAGASAFVQALRKGDEAAAILFGPRLLRSTPFVDDASVLAQRLEGVEPLGNTALNDFLYLSLRMLDERQGRRVIVLLSDGADLHSTLSSRDVLWKARRSQSLVYWIRLLDNGRQEDGGFRTNWRNAEQNREEIRNLERLVTDSGGRILPVGEPKETVAAFREIVSELREQYVLGYYPSSVRNDGSWHDVEVRVRGHGLRVRTRPGYVDY